MNTSNAFSDYQVTYTVNRSINLSPSPTSGRLHRQKQRSYGPTICLLNRSRQKMEESTAVDTKEEALLERIFMLTLEVQRLGQALRQAHVEGEERMIRSRQRETSLLRDQNQKLRINLTRLEAMQTEHEKRQQGEFFDLKQKLSIAEADNRSLARRLRDSEQKMAQLQRREKASQSVAQRAKLQASRMEMSMHFNSTNIDLHKSMAREKAIEVDALRQRVARCEDIINDQKFLIAGQKEELSREKIKVFEAENRQATEMDLLRNKHAAELDYLRKQLQFTQRELLARGEEESKKWQAQVKDLRSRATQAEQELREKCLIIANQLTTIVEHQQRTTELSRQINDMQFACHSQVIRAEESVKLASKQRQREAKKTTKQLQRYAEEVQQLRAEIEQYKLALAQKHHEAEQSQAEATLKLRQKDKEMKRITKKTREEAEAKLNKSLSVDNSLVSNRLRASQVNLEGIVNCVLDLRNSNERTSKLITKSISQPPVRDIYYAK